MFSFEIVHHCLKSFSSHLKSTACDWASGNELSEVFKANWSPKYRSFFRELEKRGPLFYKALKNIGKEFKGTTQIEGKIGSLWSCAAAQRATKCFALLALAKYYASWPEARKHILQRWRSQTDWFRVCVWSRRRGRSHFGGDSRN